MIGDWSEYDDNEKDSDGEMRGIQPGILNRYAKPVFKLEWVL